LFFFDVRSFVRSIRSIVRSFDVGRKVRSFDGRCSMFDIRRRRRTTTDDDGRRTTTKRRKPKSRRILFVAGAFMAYASSLSSRKSNGGERETLCKGERSEGVQEQNADATGNRRRHASTAAQSAPLHFCRTSGRTSCFTVTERSVTRITARAM